jgi:hypothetical protein
MSRDPGHEAGGHISFAHFRPSFGLVRVYKVNGVRIAAKNT